MMISCGTCGKIFKKVRWTKEKPPWFCSKKCMEDY